MKGGIVYLIGAGPGDPGLITLRGLECLKQANVVIYDRLVNRSLLAYARHAEQIDVGKQPNRHTMPQPEINALLIDKARAGNNVVRLKGGDPFVFEINMSGSTKGFFQAAGADQRGRTE